MAGKNFTQAQEQELAGLAGFENTINNIIGGVGSNAGENAGTDTPVQLVTNIELDKTTRSFDLNGTDTLIATITPENATNKNVTWKSSDETVAKVEDGKITAVNYGNATITVEAQDGSGVSATCNIKEKEKLSPGDYVKLDNDERTFYIDRKLYRL